MTQEPHHFISISEILAKQQTDGRVYRQQAPNLKETRHNRSQCLRNCLRFCFKKRSDMEQRGATADLKPGPHTSHTSLSSLSPLSPLTPSSSEGGLREITTSWFIQTQASRITSNGLFPNWFFGFVSRKDAEDRLKSKEVGCFLVRLSDKALGYILSYKGRNNYRHFVINQTASGELVVLGDSHRHDTVSALIQFFRERPIEPFGEYLTSSCSAIQNEDLYDTFQISPKDKSGATVNTEKKLMRKPESELVLTQDRGPNRPSELPPLPRRRDNGPETQESVCYAVVRRKKPKDEVRGPCRPLSLCSMVLQDSRSRSLPLLLSSSEELSYKLSVTAPRDSPEASHSPGPPSRGPSPAFRAEDRGGPSPALRAEDRGGPCPALRAEDRGGPCPALRAEDRGVYAEVPATHRPAAENTYEQIPENNHYEPVGPLRVKHGPSPWGPKNEKWKRFFPEAKRK